jgi:molybdenum cofactor cytidylyltransferase
MGSDKALLPWPPPVSGFPLSGETFASAAIRSLGDFTDQVIVVAGRNESVLAPAVYAAGGSVVRNPTPELGQFSSLRVGLREVLNLGRDAAMITLVDRPPPRAATLEYLRGSFEAAPAEVWAVVPEFDGRHGHPFLAGREIIEAFLKAPATATAREVEHQQQGHISYLVVDDSYVTMNVNTPEEYAALSIPQAKMIPKA